MIFYFSATGNSKYIASRLARYTQESMVYMVDVLNSEDKEYIIPEGERIGIVSPTYAWGIPTVVGAFLKQVRFRYEGNPYIYFVATYGTTSGHSGYFANRCLKKHHKLTFDAYYSVRMPDTWTPIFDLRNKDKLKRIHNDVEQQLDMLLDRVACLDRGDFRTDKVPAFTRGFYKLYYDRMRETSNFHLEDSCISCGLCASKCPTKAIRMIDGHPVWVKDQCTMCLGCLHRCPGFAIQYGKNTIRHGQYIHPEGSV